MSLAVTCELVPGFELDRLKVRCDFPAPPDAPQYHRLLGRRVCFGHAWHLVRQPAAWLERPREPCSRMPAAPLQVLGAWQRQQHPDDIDEWIRQLLMDQCGDGFHSLVGGLAHRHRSAHAAAAPGGPWNVVS